MEWRGRKREIENRKTRVTLFLSVSFSLLFFFLLTVLNCVSVRDTTWRGNVRFGRELGLFSLRSLRPSVSSLLLFPPFSLSSPHSHIRDSIQIIYDFWPFLSL